MSTPKSVTNGVALLDERLPNWRDLIDWERLDLEDCEECILGQLFGDYSRGRQALGLTKPGRFGFTIAGRGSWANLNAAWRKVRAQAGSSS